MSIDKITNPVDDSSYPINSNASLSVDAKLAIIREMLTNENNLRWFKICDPSFEATSHKYLSIPAYNKIKDDPSTVNQMIHEGDSIAENIGKNIEAKIDTIKHNPYVANMFITHLQTIGEFYRTDTTPFFNIHAFAFFADNLTKLKEEYTQGKFGDCFEVLSSSIRNPIPLPKESKALLHDGDFKINLEGVLKWYLRYYYTDTPFAIEEGEEDCGDKRVSLYQLAKSKIKKDYPFAQNVNVYERLFGNLMPVNPDNTDIAGDSRFENMNMKEIRETIRHYNHFVEENHEAKIAAKGLMGYLFLLNFNNVLEDEVRRIYSLRKQALVGDSDSSNEETTSLRDEQKRDFIVLDYIKNKLIRDIFYQDDEYDLCKNEYVVSLVDNKHSKITTALPKDYNYWEVLGLYLESVVDGAIDFAFRKDSIEMMKKLWGLRLAKSDEE